VSIRIDASEFRTFASDMFRGLDRVPDEAHRVVERAAVNIKDDLQRQMRGSTHFRPVASGINYDMRAGYLTSQAEIGPARGRPGSLANIAYFGGANGGGGTVEDPDAALGREIPNLERHLADVVEGLF